MSEKHITVVLAGNPNSGKTTLFNVLTGARQRVGNYPGVTVEKKEGICRFEGRTLRVLDLPGTYSLTAYSLEELVARNFVVQEKPDVLIQVLDSTNLERNLYLGVQFMELGVPMVFALNMSDEAKSQGIEFDIETLSRLLGAPMIPTVGSKGIGREELLRATIEVAEEKRMPPVQVHYGPDIETELAEIRNSLHEKGIQLAGHSGRWVALKLLENDSHVRDLVAEQGSQGGDVLKIAEVSRNRLRKVGGDEPEFLIADRRYGFISGACQETVRLTVEMRHNRSDAMDAVITHRILGIPIFLALMYGAFWLTFRVGEGPMLAMEHLFAWLTEMVSSLWPEGSDSILRSLLVDGIIAGVGGVLSFLPIILLLFFAIAILEDSGYMARASFIMDQMMHKIGLHGKSFIPMLIGFGCTVPAIMGTRILESRRDRLTTMLVLPLVSCGARFPIYALLIPAFFPEPLRAPVLFSIYLIGILLAIVLIKILRSTLFRGETSPLVMELPPYRLPTLRGLLIHMWQRGWAYLRKAGTIILTASIVMWAVSVFPSPSAEVLDGLETEEEIAQVRLTHSLVGRIGKGLEPITQPLGFDWRINSSFIGAFAAKELFVAQMGIIFALGDVEEDADTEGEDLAGPGKWQHLRLQLQRDYSPLQAFCIMLFALIATPCMATIAVTRKESGAWKWAFLQLGGLTGLAYLVTLICYQVGKALRLG